MVIIFNKHIYNSTRYTNLLIYIEKELAQVCEYSMVGPADFFFLVTYMGS